MPSVSVSDKMVIVWKLSKCFEKHSTALLILSRCSQGSISSSDKYNALTQLYYNQNGNESNQQYLMDSYLRLMKQNNNYAKSTGRKVW